MRYWFIKRVKGNLNDFSIFTESGHNYDRKLKGGQLIADGSPRSTILHRILEMRTGKDERSCLG